MREKEAALSLIGGLARADGKFEPFHLYSMRQAIEEGFILDVLANYTTYTAYWRLLKKGPVDEVCGLFPDQPQELVVHAIAFCNNDQP